MEAFETDRSVKMRDPDHCDDKKKDDEFWITCKAANPKNDKPKEPMRIKMSFEIIPADLAKLSPVGSGRGDPN